MFSAYDNRNVQGNSVLNIYIYMDFKQPLDYYVVTFTFVNFQRQAWNVRVQYMHVFVNTLIKALGEYYRNYIFLKTFNIDTVTLAGNATWGLRVFPGCNFTMIRTVQSIMFSSLHTKSLAGSFTQALKVNYEVTSITEILQGGCKIEPPFKKNELPELQIDFCGVFRYQIPSNAFHDNQDGDTRNLTLSLFDMSMRLIESQSWIGLDPYTQTIYAVPAAGSVKAGSYTFKLVATDSSNQSLTCDLVVKLSGSPPTTAYKVTVIGDFDTSSTTTMTKSYALAMKVEEWMAGDSSQFLLLDNQLTSAKQTYLTFSQCSWRYDPCDTIKIDAFRNRFFNTDGSPKTAFISSLAPEFQQVQVSSSTSGPCLDDRKPDIGEPWGPFAINPCSTFREQVPANAFNDREEGDTRKLNLILKVNPPMPALPVWLLFDTTTQTLTMVAYEKLTDTSFEFTLDAFDSKEQSASQNLKATLSKRSGEVSHLVEMTLQVTTPGLTEFTAIYSTLRQHIKSYFADQNDLMEYYSMSSGSVILNVKWSNCQISRTSCEREKITAFKDRLVLQDDSINPNFKQALQQDFDVQSLKVALKGICIEENTPPVVVNSLPEQSIRYCGYYQYTVPENTFSDKIDGGTRNLKLSVKKDGSVALPSWIAFSEYNQQFLVLLISTEPAAQNITTFTVTATTKRGISVSTNIVFRIMDSPLPEQRYLKVSVQSNKGFKSDNATSLLTTYIELLEKIGHVYNLTVSKTTFYKLTAMNPYMSPRVISCGVHNCTMGEIESKIHYPELPTYDTARFQPEFVLVNQDLKVGTEKCQGETKPPVVLQNIKAFTVYRCRTFQKEITGEVGCDGLLTLPGLGFF